MSVTAATEEEKVDFLDAYIENYLKEEIQQEALTRNLDSFYRFLTIAATVNGQLLNVANIAREVGVARSTVQGYFSILEDTHLGWYLPAWRNRTKVKEVAHVKFYLFDCGVQRALAGLHRDIPSSEETGTLFETFVLNEFRALNSWLSLGARFHFWRTPSGNEVDLIWRRGNRAAGFEIKSSSGWKSSFNKGLNALLESGEIEQAFGVYQGGTHTEIRRRDRASLGNRDQDGRGREVSFLTREPAPQEFTAANPLSSASPGLAPGDCHAPDVELIRQFDFCRLHSTKLKLQSRLDK